MTLTRVRELKPFVPARDFELSLSFYQRLGCTLNWRNEGLAELDLNGRPLLLQDHYQRDWAENSMLYVVVDDIRPWAERAGDLVDSGRFPGTRCEPPRKQAWGDVVAYVWDPAGVLLHFAQPSAARRRTQPVIRPDRLARPPSGGREPHYRSLERAYQAAPVNRLHQPAIHVSDGFAEIRFAAKEEFFHGAGALHGSVYFKALDDAAFFAANSRVEGEFVVTASFNIHLLRPVSAGELVATGRLVNASRRLLVAAAELHDDRGRLLASGSGSFMPSGIPIEASSGTEPES